MKRFVEVPLQITVQPRSWSHLGQFDENMASPLNCSYPPQAFTVLSSKPVDTGDKSDPTSSARMLLVPPSRDFCNKVITISRSGRVFSGYGI